jgi:hypothetical protein
MSKKIVKLRDDSVFDRTKRTVLSIRDGVLEYYGKEIGEEPADKVFRVYRSPATTANAAMVMTGIPVTDEHIDLDTEQANIPTVGKVERAKMVDVSDRYVGATVAVLNNLKLNDEVLPVVESGKRELSLGYFSALIPHDTYDFEQTEIRPHHLAIVKHGRAGSMCSFIDKKTVQEEESNMKFLKDGKIDIQALKDALKALPEALKGIVDTDKTEIEPLMTALADSLPKKKEEPMTEGIKTTDAKTETEKKETGLTDADIQKLVDAGIQRGVAEGVKRHVLVSDKARHFLPDNYKFADKTADEIVADVLAQEYPEHHFSDNEKNIAFNLLKIERPTADYSKFGDSAAKSAWTDAGNKEV